MQPPPITSATGTQLVHVGRQPVFDRTGAVIGYELLFRGSLDAVEAAHRNTYATSHVIVNAFTEFGLAEVVGDRLCFLNLTREFLVGEPNLPFGPEQAVLEVLETVAIDEEVIAGVSALADAGYRIALDDFVWGLGHEKLLGLASFVKLDLLDGDASQVDRIIAACREYPAIQLVAERLETAEDLARAERLGFDLFQGYALSRPHVLTTSTLSPSRLRRLELLGVLTSPNADVDQILSIILSDPALSFRVLRASSSASTGVTRRVASVREAVVLLGLARIRQWTMLMVIDDVAQATEEQMTATMARARLCEALADRYQVPADAAFTVGLLAGVADLLALSPADLVTQLPLTPEVSAALLAGDGALGEVLRVVDAYERGDVQALVGLPMDPVDLARAYLDVLRWSVRTIRSAQLR